MRNILLALILNFFILISIDAQIIITEIMYNPPESGTDHHEYIELYNAGNDTIEMKDYAFTDGIKMKFGFYSFAPKSYLVVTNDSATIKDFGIDALIWTSGGLKNSGEAIELSDPNGNVIDKVDYDDGGEWVSEPDGGGPSLELCSLNKDNSIAKNWKASVHPIGFSIEGKEYFGTPGNSNSVNCDSVVDSTVTKLVITEILYNDPGSPDSLEFIELFNAGKETTYLENFELKSNAINFIFPDRYIKPNQFLIISKNKSTFNKYFNTYSLSWGNGGLSNKSDTIILLDNNLDTLDIVEYHESGDWPEEADGYGYSLSLCNPISDNNNGQNWQASPISAGFKYNNIEIHANPGQKNYCGYDIEYLHEKDSIGAIIHSDANPFIEGTIYGINYNSKGLQFVVADENDRGIWCYSYDKNFGYSVHEGDKIILWGTMNQFYGLEQIKLDSVILAQEDSIISSPKIVTNLNESTEGQLVTLENVHLVDYTKWSNSGSGFNVRVTNDIDTFNIRIDNDSEIYGHPHPLGTFNITGLGGQYDKIKPYFDGYQLLPRYLTDIDPYDGEAYPYKHINEVTQIDDEGVGLSIGEKCELRGVVYGTNLRPNGLQFTIIDELKDGISVFLKTGNKGFTVVEGYYISIKGQIDQYNGLLQIIPDTIVVISEESSQYPPYTVTKLDENTESQLVTIKNCSIKKPEEWKGDGSSFNVTITNGNNDFTMRIDNDIDLSTMTAPDYSFNLTGIGGQYDPSKPYTDGYQIMPRYASDIEKTTSTFEQEEDNIVVYPNPVNDYIFINTNGKIFNKAVIYSTTGIKEIEIPFKSKIMVSNLFPGIYNIIIYGKNEVIVKKFLKIQ